MNLRRSNTTLRWLAIFTVLILGAMMLLSGCEGQDPVSADGTSGDKRDPVGNIAPETHLTLVLPPDEMPDTSRSSKTINWWGEDVDGNVVGYEYRWGILEFDSSGVAVDTLWYDSDWSFVDQQDEERWISTTQEEVDFVLPIRSVSATFHLQVRAVDNDGALDSTPAKISFPIINSKPSIDFRLGSNPRVSAVGDTFTTFPVRSFVWDATDPDGNESIDKVLYVLDPELEDSSGMPVESTDWLELDGNESSISFTDLEPGEHTFWVKVVDVAGFESLPIHFPNPDNDIDPEVWRVKPPAPGGFLIVDDYAQESSNITTEFYRSILDSLYNEGEDGLDEVYSVMELLELPYTSQDLTNTLDLFDDVIWYAYRGTPLVTQAFSSMYSFINSPGKQMLLTSVVVDPGEEGVNEGMLIGLASGIEQFPTRLIPSDDHPVFLQPVDVPALPELQLVTLINPAPFELIPTDAAEVLYQLNPSTADPPQYTGTPVVGVRRPDKSYTLITFPLHLLETESEVGALIENTFME